jgi:hypothetical protein
MKNLNSLKVISTIIVLIIIASSCSSSKKMALSCPEPANNYKSKTSLNHPRHKKNLFTVSKRESKNSYAFSKQASRTDRKHNNSVNNLHGLNKPQSNPASVQSGNVDVANRIEYEANLYAEADHSASPVEEVYFNASTNKGEFADFGNNEAIYERAEIIPVSSALKPEIDYFKHSVENLSSFTTNLQQDGTITPPKTEALGLAGMIVSLAGLLILPIPCGIVGIIFSAISLSRFKKYPGKYKGKGFAIAGLAVGVVVLILGIIILAAAV